MSVQINKVQISKLNFFGLVKYPKKNLQHLKWEYIPAKLSSYTTAIAP